jgi:hypothetical protein
MSFFSTDPISQHLYNFSRLVGSAVGKRIHWRQPARERATSRISSATHQVVPSILGSILEQDRVTDGISSRQS